MAETWFVIVTRKPSWRKGCARQQCVYTAILDFWNFKVAPLVRPSPKTPPYNQIARRSANRLRSYGHFCIYKMAVSCHLGFCRIGNSAIRSAFPENPSLEPNMEWIGCTFAIYSRLNYTVTLKLAFGVTEGHRKRHYSIEHVRLCTRLL